MKKEIEELNNHLLKNMNGIKTSDKYPSEYIDSIISELSSKRTSMSIKDHMSYEDFCTSVEIPEEWMNDYRKELILEMKKMDASESEFKLVTDEVIRSSIYNESRPCDVAWALVQ